VPLEASHHTGTLYAWAERGGPGEEWEVTRVELAIAEEGNKRVLVFPPGKENKHKGEGEKHDPAEGGKQEKVVEGAEGEKGETRCKEENSEDCVSSNNLAAQS